MTIESDGMDWARKFVDDKQMVLHFDTFLVGVPTKLHAPGEAKGTNGEPVMGWVVEMDDGSTLIANEELFMPLNAQSAKYYQTLVMVTTQTCIEATKLGASLGFPVEVVRRLMCSALQAQIRAMQTPMPDA